MKKLSLLFLVGVIAAQSASRDEPAQQYVEPEAYAVYSAILQTRWTKNDFPEATKLFINEKTVTFHKMCLRPDRESQEIIGQAITNYDLANQTSKKLQAKFTIQPPYEIVSAESSSPFRIDFSAVGFNKDKTIAVVSVGRAIPSMRSYSGSFAVLAKKNGKWQPQKWNGETCAWST